MAISRISQKKKKKKIQPKSSHANIENFICTKNIDASPPL